MWDPEEYYMIQPIALLKKVLGSAISFKTHSCMQHFSYFVEKNPENIHSTLYIYFYQGTLRSVTKSFFSGLK